MGDHTEIRLEKDGVVVAYFAPNFQVADGTKNDILEVKAPRQQARTFDFQSIGQELTIQGTFQDSDELPAAHRTALETLFSVSAGTVVTGREQFNRIKKYVHVDGSPFDFFDADDEYTATSAGGVDFENGVHPQVFIQDIRRTSNAGNKRQSYVVKMLVGIDAAGEQ